MLIDCGEGVAAFPARSLMAKLNATAPCVFAGWKEAPVSVVHDASPLTFVSGAYGPCVESTCILTALGSTPEPPVSAAFTVIAGLMVAVPENQAVGTDAALKVGAMLSTLMVPFPLPPLVS